MYPALLNCSKFSTEEGRPLSWICTQHLDLDSLVNITNQNQYMRAALSRLLSCLWESSFNLSSEKHEGASWFSETVHSNIDERISTIEMWEEATKNDPLFVLNVPWLNTNRTVEQIAERIFQHHNARYQKAASTSDFARIVFNNKKYQPITPF
jgi:hypothetical protein